MVASLCLPSTQAGTSHNTMTIGSRKEWDAYLRECLCKIPPTPLTSVFIEEITESLMDLRAPAPKKGQTTPAVEGFAPLVLALPAITESSSSAKVYPRNLSSSWSKSFRSFFAWPSHHQSKVVLLGTKSTDARRCGHSYVEALPLQR